MEVSSLRGDEVRAFAEFVAGGDEVERVSAILGGQGLSMMPVKGALLQRMVYDAPADRRITDVDILVGPGCFDAAIEALVEAGYQRGHETALQHEMTLRRPDAALAVDLHRSLFDSGRYRMETEGVFDRASEDEELFGMPVMRMHEFDIYAHTVGKIASDHIGLARPAMLEDLHRLGEASRLSPQRHARHLDALGMGRAARYALSLLRVHSPSAFVEQISLALRTDWIGASVARAAVFMSVRHGKFSTSAKLGGVLLASSLPASIRLGLKGLGRRRQRLA